MLVTINGCSHPDSLSLLDPKLSATEKADSTFKFICRKVKKYGSLDKNPRPVWIESDGTRIPAHTFSINGVTISVDVANGESPLLSLRRIAWKYSIAELLWIYQAASNDLVIFDQLIGKDTWEEDQKINNWWEEWAIRDKNGNYVLNEQGHPHHRCLLRWNRPPPQSDAQVVEQHGKRPRLSSPHHFFVARFWFRRPSRPEAMRPQKSICGPPRKRRRLPRCQRRHQELGLWYCWCNQPKSVPCIPLHGCKTLGVYSRCHHLQHCKSSTVRPPHRNHWRDAPSKLHSNVTQGDFQHHRNKLLQNPVQRHQNRRLWRQKDWPSQLAIQVSCGRVKNWLFEKTEVFCPGFFLFLIFLFIR